MERYVDALLRELDFRKYEIKDAISTIYLGGGTPSMLPAGLLEQLMTGLHRLIDFQTAHANDQRYPGSDHRRSSYP